MTKFGMVFVLVLVGCSIAAFALPTRAQQRETLGPGVVANQRLTAVTGAPLYVLIAAIAVTTLYLPRWLPEHYVVGVLLLPPIVLKMASTSYRFVRYYTGSVAYRLAGPPPALLRLLVAPALLASTIVVFATGIELWLFGMRFGSIWMTAHTLSAVVFVLAAGGHVLGHLRRSSEVTLDEIGARASGSTVTRRSLVLASLLAGVVLAVASLLYATPYPPTAGG